MAVIKEGPARHRDGDGWRTGVLRIEGRYLRFAPAGGEPARSGAGVGRSRSGEIALHITDIKRLSKPWAPVLGIPLLPTGLGVAMRNGEQHRFVVSGRKGWIAELERSYDDTPGR